MINREVPPSATVLAREIIALPHEPSEGYGNDSLFWSRREPCENAATFEPTEDFLHARIGLAIDQEVSPLLTPSD